MMGWFRGSIDPKEAFPIDSFPLETLGEKTGDALALLYKKTPARNAVAGFLPAPVTVDRQKEDFFRRVLPILDGFDNIFRYAERINLEGNETLGNWLKTLETLYRRLQSALEKEGLLAIESKGAPLDLSMHEVVDIRDDPTVPNNIVVEELVKGYQFGRRVLRDAKVVVAKNSKPATQPDREDGEEFHG